MPVVRRAASRRGSRTSGRLLDEPLHAPLEAGKAVDDLGLERLDGEERDEADHRAHRASGTRAAAGEVQDVVKEAVLLVPELDALAAERRSSRAQM